MQLKDLCTIKSSKRIFEKEYVESGIPFIRGQEVSNNTLFSGEKFDCYITKERYEELKTQYGVPQIGDILITAVGTIGNLCYIESPLKFYYKDGNLIQFTNFKSNVNSKFLYYFMKSSTFKKQLDHYLIGAVQKALTMDMLGKIEIDLPDRSIQDKIAEILSNIDNQIERNNEMTKRLQVLGNTIYSKNALMQTEFFNIQDESELIWGTCPPDGHILDAENPKTQKYASGAGDILDGRSLISPKGYTDKPIRIAKEKDVCMSIAGTIGKIGICTETIAIGRAMLGVRSKNLYGYIYFGLQTFGKTLNKKSTGAIQKIINKDHIKIINFPKYNEDIRIQLNSIFDEIVLIENDTIKLQNLKSKLLPLLINGQINI